MDVGFRRPVVVGGHDGVPIFGGVPPVGISRINTLVHGHHRRLVHVIVDGWLYGGLLVVGSVIVRRTIGGHVHTGGTHLGVVHGRAYAVHV